MHSVFVTDRDCGRNQAKLLRKVVKKTFVFLWEVKMREPGENLLKIENQLLLNSIKFLLLLNFVMSKLNLNFT